MLFYFLIVKFSSISNTKEYGIIKHNLKLFNTLQVNELQAYTSLVPVHSERPIGA